MALEPGRRHYTSMTTPADDLHASLSSIDSLKAYLADVVATAVKNRGPKVELTYVGGEFRKITGLTFEHYLNGLAEQEVLVIPKAKRKLAEFIESYCGDLIGRQRSTAGTWLVYPAGLTTSAEAAMSQAGPPAVMRFKPAVWAAFLRPVAAGHRFLNLEQIGFTDVDQAPAVGQWKEIDGRYILGVKPDEPVDGGKVQSHIEAWAREATVPLPLLMVSPAKDVARPLQQLLDLIDILPPDVAQSWSIPAAVLKHLSRAR